MKRSALVLLLLGSTNTACFRPTLECARCGLSERCPSGLACNAGFCTTSGGLCTSASDGTDGPADHAGETSICVGARCISQPPGLVVWADRTSLPAESQPITTWFDRSGNNHPVTAFNPGVAPVVVGGFANIESPQEVLAVQDGTALNFGSSDFTIMVLARCNSGSSVACVFDDATMSGLDLRLYCNVADVLYAPDAGAPDGIAGPLDRAKLQLTDTSAPVGQSVIVSTRDDIPDALHLYVARRIRGVLQLRIDSQFQEDMMIASTFDRNAPLFVGSCATLSRSTGFRGTLGALIVIKGSLDDDQLTSIENFVLTTMGPNAPPLP
jgi:hypothetical protein